MPHRLPHPAGRRIPSLPRYGLRLRARIGSRHAGNFLAAPPAAARPGRFRPRRRDPDHVRLAKATSAADTLTRTPPGTTPTDLTAGCSGRPVTGTTKRNCPAITLDSALLPDATETVCAGSSWAAGPAGAWSANCRAWSANCRAWSANCRAWSANCRTWSASRRTWSASRRRKAAAPRSPPSPAG